VVRTVTTLAACAILILLSGFLWKALAHVIALDAVEPADELHDTFPRPGKAAAIVATEAYDEDDWEQWLSPTSSGFWSIDWYHIYSGTPPDARGVASGPSVVMTRSIATPSANDNRHLCAGTRRPDPPPHPDRAAQRGERADSARQPQRRPRRRLGRAAAGRLLPRRVEHLQGEQAWIGKP